MKGVHVAIRNTTGYRSKNVRTKRWLRILGDAGRILAESLELSEVMSRIASVGSSIFYDYCILDLWQEETGLVRTTLSHARREDQAWLEEVSSRHPYAGDPTEPAIQAIRNRFIVYVDSVNGPVLERGTALVAIAREMRATNLVAVPLIARGHIIGVMNLAARDPYEPEDFQFLRELGSRAALHMDNARLFSDLRNAVRLRDDFLSIVAHELNTPLAALQLYLENLQRSVSIGEPFSEKAARKVDGAVVQVDRVAALVARMLDINRINAERLKLEIERCDLAAIVRKVVSARGAAEPSPGSPIQLELPDSLFCTCDPARMEQALDNLIDNAARYGGGNPTRVSLQLVGDEAVIEVRDRGAGIAPEELARIFDRFERGRRSRRAGGLGLGLFLSDQIVKAHGGSIRVHSMAGSGSRFILTLPLLARPTKEPAVAAPASRPNGQRVLLVEDDPDVRSAIAEVLSEEHYDVVTASNGQEALHLLSLAPAPSVILLDLWMPVLDGWKFREAQRGAAPSIADIPVVVMSGTPPEPPLDGVGTVLRKPVRVQELLGALNRVLNASTKAS